MSTTLATHADQESSQSEHDKEFVKLQRDIQDLGRKDLAILKSELDRIVKEAERMKTSLKDDVSRAHGGVRLDINLERARIKDEAVGAFDADMHYNLKQNRPYSCKWWRMRKRG